MAVADKYVRLENILKKLKRVLIAYSGGVDSTFLLAVASNILGKENVLAVTSVSETYPSSEINKSKTIAKKLNISHTITLSHELKNINFKTNPIDRCFYCKDELFSKLSKIAKDKNMILCDATNSSDSKDFRPGRKAAIKWGVVSPLKEAGLIKSEIRYYSKKMHLPTWNIPAQACLASRFPYGMEISKNELKKIELGELYLKRFGLFNIRIRNHGNIARIEVDPDKFKVFILPQNRKKIVSYLNRLGWKHITIDLQGYKTGSLNPF